MMTVWGFSGISIDRSYAVNASVDQINWLVIFRQVGDVDVLIGFPVNAPSCSVNVVEFIRGSRVINRLYIL